MPTGISPGRADASIDAAIALGTWIGMHLGDPGAAGAAHPAAETSRRQAAFAPASGGEAVTTAPIEWLSPAADEYWTHFTMWTAPVGGTFLWSGTVTANQTRAGVPFRVDAGDLHLIIQGAA